MTFDNIKTEYNKKLAFKDKHPEIHRIEKKIVDETVDKYVNRMAKKCGFRKANWLLLTKSLIGF